ncbi:hypothetical protein [Chryseobacterium paridis]|uniref:Outer membrane protein beta-barrel domain-containing protein n=1 Tax=Chryseobacterium paridis TaxID=2800328 RepID=A0ABS1FWZ1_9FLAO|nr:hypothetical protein [Chryseobacterium paridis]MBK1896848.1 hypothetical protein [Chryseobacterium paridis]
MKNKITLLAAVLAFSYSFAQENPPMESQMKIYSKKIDSIVVSEKSNMNTELDIVDKDFKENKITSEEKKKKRIEIAVKYEQIINEKVSTQQSELENATKEMVKNSVLQKPDTLNANKNEMQFGFDGIKVRLNKNKKTPKDYLHTLEFSINLTGTTLTPKDKPFKFYDKDSDVKNTIVNSSSYTLRYEDQIGSFTSPFFYRVGLGVRMDRFVPKYGKVFTQENKTLFIEDFTRGNLKETALTNSYLFVPVDFRFVLNPKYIEYEGVKYLDSRKKELSIIAGIYGGVKVGSVIYNRFSTENSKRIVERERAMQGVNTFIFGGKFGISYAGINLFIQKDFTPIFNNDARLRNKYGLQIGIEIANINF